MALHFKLALDALRGRSTATAPLNANTAAVSIDELIRVGVGEGDFAAKNCATVFACVRLLSDCIASLPLKLMRIDNKGNRLLDTTNPLYDVLELRPNSWMDKFTFWKFCINSLLFRGLFVAHIIRDSSGRVVRLIPVKPANIDVESIDLDDSGELRFPITTREGERRIYSGRDLFYCFYETLDGVKPVSPLKYARATVDLARKSEEFGIATLRKSAVPPGYYSTDEKLNREAFEVMREQLASADIGRAPLLDRGIKYNTVSMTAEDMQMLGTRRYQKEEICSFFGVSPHMIGDTAQAKGWSTMEQQNTEFVQYSLTPYLVRIENAIRTRLLDGDPRRYAKFNIGGLLRGDSAARANYYRTLYTLGALNPNEIREKEDMNGIDGGETYYRQANMTPETTAAATNGDPDNGNE